MIKDKSYKINTTCSLTPHDITASIDDYNEIAKFIVSMDEACQEWEMTIKLIAHFKALELELKKEEGSEYVEIKPKKIK